MNRTHKGFNRKTVAVYSQQVKYSFRTEIGGNSDIISLFMNWRDYVPYKEVTTKPVDAAFREFAKAQLRYQLSKGEPDQLVITGVTPKYSSQVAAAAITEKYLQPVYIFDGYVKCGNDIKPFDPVYIPATIEQYDQVPGGC